MLARAVDIRRWLHDDRHTSYGERLERDRAIGRTLTERDPRSRLLAWWQQLAPADDAAGERLEAGRRLASLALAVLGMVLGAAVAGAAFSYDGRYPVNLFTLLGVLVGLPLIMLVLTLLLLPGRLPGLKTLQGVAAGMSPGRWVGVWLDRLLDAELFAPGLLRGGGASAFSRWQLVVFSQWLALGFFTGVLTVALLLVTFTDLAFGWSTTLDLKPSLIHGWVVALSAPWAGWLPQAAPDASLVEASRYFRLEEGRMAQARIERLGAWWPFVLMTMIVYGALPRLLLLAIGAWRLRYATRAMLMEDPEVTALLDRLDAPLVNLGADRDEDALDAGQERLPAPSDPIAGQEGLVMLIWNGATAAETAGHWLVATLGVQAAGHAELSILQREAEQRAALGRLRESVAEPVRRTMLITKGWEPPLLEFMDFLTLVREELGNDGSITVVPLDVSGRRVLPKERDVWARALARVRDPRLYVMDAVGETAP
jgi:hypothetical protein